MVSSSSAFQMRLKRGWARLDGSLGGVAVAVAMNRPEFLTRHQHKHRPALVAHRRRILLPLQQGRTINPVMLGPYAPMLAGAPVDTDREIVAHLRPAVRAGIGGRELSAA